ncbi:hypothetical protein HPP92_015461 [Vanilla planifolia]|uniref:Vps72/YL1 C-terminal domain-containing protein n=1 Tax=Vanilla planifolia TaxID=51239 RepID=A0A835QLW4_VANPL|nr:hypothetical protein HPP92_015461 [Vanilla planifolia]
MEPEVVNSELLLPTVLLFKKVQMGDKYPKGQARGRHWKHLKQILQAENYQSYPANEPNYLNIETPPSMYPSKKFCDITGFEAPYVDPRTKLRYASPEEIVALLLLLLQKLDLAFFVVRNDSHWPVESHTGARSETIGEERERIGSPVFMYLPALAGVVNYTSQCVPFMAFSSVRQRKIAGIVARLGGEATNLNLQAALQAAYLRFQETLRPDPLFIDPYAERLVSPLFFDHDPNPMISPVHYRLATKFIDDRILHEIGSMQELRQIVLLTDGMDTRPYRLNWPRRTVIYDISPENVFKEAYQKLQGCGAKVSKFAMMIHTSLESSNLQILLPKKGFDGKRSSLCVLQGLPILTLDDFVGILSLVSSLAMKGCLFVGELPCWLLCTKHDDKFLSQLALQRWMEKLFLSNGFQVKVVDYNELARDMHDLPKAGPANVLFVAKQLKLSDAQMDAWRVHFERIEEEGDEEGFEEL